MKKILIWIKERLLLCYILGCHGYSNVEDARNNKCSFCGCDFKGYLKD